MTDHDDGGADHADATASIHVGDYCVYRHSYGYSDAGPVTRCTDASAYFAKDYGRTKERRISFGDIVFSGSEPDAKLLMERLRSSGAQCSSEVDGARLRHRARNEKLIADAMLAARSAS